jgi:UDP-N-acetylglucosamine acyltransferase
MVGSGCLLMACSHAGHDSAVRSGVVLANFALRGGFVSLGDRCFVGGGASVHQHARIGEHASFGSCSAATRDFALYAMSADRSDVVGSNFVGLRRAGFDRNRIIELKGCFSAM